VKIRSNGVTFSSTLFSCASGGICAIRESYRNLEEIMLECGLQVDHTTIYRWVQQYAPELERRCHPHLKSTTDSWRVDETYIKVKKQWMYLYRAVD
jgi:IS6 family transposase